MAFTVVDVQPTPNPNAVKFVLDRPVAEERLSFFDREAAQAHPLAAALFEIKGISSLLLLGDFITVNKTPAARWRDINAAVRKALARHD